MWSNVVEETGEPGENHRTWTGDHTLDLRCLTQLNFNSNIGTTKQKKMPPAMDVL